MRDAVEKAEQTGQRGEIVAQVLRMVGVHATKFGRVTERQKPKYSGGGGKKQGEKEGLERPALYSRELWGG